MSLIDETYFVSDISLPGQVLEGTYANITNYISKYERKALINLLGYDLYKELKAEIDAGEYTDWGGLVNGAEFTTDDGYTVKWEGLINDNKESLIAYFVYVHYMRDNVTHTSQSGEVRQAVENATRLAGAQKVAYAYNRYSELVGGPDNSWLAPSAYNYLYSLDLEDWVFTRPQNINQFGI